METLLQAVENQLTSDRISCPACAPDRKKSHEKTLDIKVEPDKTLYHCFHCDASGKIEKENWNAKYIDEAFPEPQQVTPIPTKLTEDFATIQTFFKERGVELSSVQDVPNVVAGEKYFHGLGKVPAIGFVYGSSEAPEAIKWRPLTAGKAFTQDGSAQTFYGIDRVPEDADTLIVVEGECDLIALNAVGIMNAVSCPNGAPQKVNHNTKRIDPSEDKKFNYVWDARLLIERCSKIVLATDSDVAGKALAEELARRIGRAKCYVLEYPDGCKDSNDILRDQGAEALKRVISNPTPMPLKGVYPATDYYDALKDLHEKGYGSGESTGIASVDELFTIAEGQLSVVTGVPSSGKSEFIDQVMVNLSKNNSWKWAVCSFENPPHVHIAKIIEKYNSTKPFFAGDNARLTEQEVKESFEWVNDHFCFLDSKDGVVDTIDSVLERARQAVLRLGIRGLVIDPYNYLVNNDEEHKSINIMLTKVTTFAKSHGIHVFFVAHPHKQYPNSDGTYAVPTGHNVSGSAAWWAKCDLGITVHRGNEGVEIHCWKARMKWIGQMGMTILKYNVLTGTYTDFSNDQSQGAFASKYADKEWKTFDYNDVEF